MASQPIDYAAVIADLENKRRDMDARFDAAVAAIRQVIALQSSGAQRALPGMVIPVPGNHDVDSPYRGLSMLDAAFAHLTAAARPVPNMELAQALERGGYMHKSKNFPNTLNSILWRRAKNEGDLRKSDQGWELVKAM